MAEDKLTKALNKAKIPVVTLDNKWHKIFSMVEKTPTIKEKEEELNNHLRRQGKLNTESKDIKKIKKKLMDEIVSLMDDGDPSSEKKVEENKRLIEDCNQKLDAYQEELMDLPALINDINKEIMLETMGLCYEAMHDNEKIIDELGEWVKNIRIELKKNVVKKQEKEIQNAVMYSYMHDVFGADAMDIFDMKYNPMEKMIQLKAAKEAGNSKNNSEKAEDKTGEKGEGAAKSGN